MNDYVMFTLMLMLLDEKCSGGDGDDVDGDGVL
jgi:hypothetical protein